MKRALFIQHDHRNPAGLLAGLFAGRGYDVARFTVVPARCHAEPWIGVAFPDPAGYDAIVPLGSDWSASDARLYTWLIPELVFLREAHAAGVPILGICFGGQLLAQALGGVVRPAPRPEIGWYWLNHSRGLGAAIFDTGPWFQWHYDRFYPPPGSVALAHTAAGAQAFTVGSSWGVQFHPEADVPLVQAWLDDTGSDEAEALGVDPAELIRETSLRADGAAARAGVLVDRFLASRPVCPVRPPASYAG
jgi:GMP synthase-like glutamine amidotransferase